MLAGIVESMLASPIGRLLLLVIVIWFALMSYGLLCDVARERAERARRRSRVTVEEIRRNELSD